MKVNTINRKLRKALFAAVAASPRFGTLRTPRRDWYLKAHTERYLLRVNLPY